VGSAAAAKLREAREDVRHGRAATVMQQVGGDGDIQAGGFDEGFVVLEHFVRLRNSRCV
jgi:hypothetical protein